MQKIISLRDAESLLADFNASRADVAEAFEILKASPKPWTTKDWADRRALLIKEKCEKCGSDEKPMVLQHLWHRRGWRDHLMSATKMACSEDGGPKVRDEECMEDRPCCPKCGSPTVRFRKTTGEWLCISTAGLGGTSKWGYQNRSPTCGHVFTDPVIKSVLNKNKRAEAQRARWDEWKATGADARKHTAMRLMIEELVRYWRFDGTETWCKRCAARMDLPLLRSRGFLA